MTPWRTPDGKFRVQIVVDMDEIKPPWTNPRYVVSATEPQVESRWSNLLLVDDLRVALDLLSDLAQGTKSLGRSRSTPDLEVRDRPVRLRPC